MSNTTKKKNRNPIIFLLVKRHLRNIVVFLFLVIVVVQYFIRRQNSRSQALQRQRAHNIMAQHIRIKKDALCAPLPRRYMNVPTEVLVQELRRSLSSRIQKRLYYVRHGKATLSLDVGMTPWLKHYWVIWIKDHVLHAQPAPCTVPQAADFWSVYTYLPPCLLWCTSPTQLDSRGDQ
jgi:hypothetical protein